MKVERDMAVAVCQALGLAAADKWENGRLAGKLESLADAKGVDAKVKEIEDKEVRNLAKAILAAVDEGKGLTVTDSPKPARGKKPAKAAEDEEFGGEEEETEETEEEEEEEVEVKKKVKGKPAKAGARPSKNGKPSKEKPERKAAREPAVKDVFGNRVGSPVTRTHRINKAIIESKRPLSVKEIEEKAKAASIHSHLWNLQQRGFVVKDDNGKYRAAKKFAGRPAVAK